MQNPTLLSDVSMHLASFLLVPESCRFWVPHPQGTPPRGQIILWDASRGHFAWHLLWEPWEFLRNQDLTCWWLVTGAAGVRMLVGFWDFWSCFNFVLLGLYIYIRYQGFLKKQTLKRRSCYLLTRWPGVTKADVVGDYKAKSFREVWWPIDGRSEMLMPSGWHHLLFCFVFGHRLSTCLFVFLWFDFLVVGSCRCCCQCCCGCCYCCSSSLLWLLLLLLILSMLMLLMMSLLLCC